MNQTLPQSVSEMTDILDISAIWHSSVYDHIKLAALILGLLLLGALLFWLFQKLRCYFKEKREQALMSPQTQALQSLARLKKQKYPEKALWSKFYFELDDILRRYICARFQFDVLDRTYEEIKALFKNISSLQEFSLQSSEDLKKIRAFWEKAQLIKFAKTVSTPEMCAEDYAMVKGFVQRTEDLDQSRKA